jgi:hypothetical protein
MAMKAVVSIIRDGSVRPGHEGILVSIYSSAIRKKTYRISGKFSSPIKIQYVRLSLIQKIVQRGWGRGNAYTLVTAYTDMLTGTRGGAAG